MNEFDTLVIIVDDCFEPIWEFENVSVVNDNHTMLEWSIDTNSFDTTYFEGYGIYRWDGVQYQFRQLLTNWKKLYYDDLTASNVDLESYSYKIDFRFSGFTFGPSDSIHSILLKGGGECDSLYLVWNQYNGWMNPQYDVYIYYKNNWVKWNDLPITDTTYCMKSDTLEVGMYDVKVVTENGGYKSESNYVKCSQPEPPTLVIPNVMTPNGDGTNDILTIQNLMVWEYRELTIFNRWGTIVYRSDDYQNDWDGGKLSDGVYFGILLVSDSGVTEQYDFTITILGD